jgi:hypothetical protein
MAYKSDYEFGVGNDNGTQLTLAADPFATYSNAIYPRTIKEVFEWAEWMWTRNGLYTQAIRKSTRYFFNDISVEGKVSYDIRRKYEKFYKDDLHIMSLAADICDEYMAFGNIATSIHIPILRSLMCPECLSSRPLKNLTPEKEYNFREYKFIGDCPVCGARQVTFKIMDVRRPSENNPIKVVRWNLRHLIIDHCNLTGESEYYYKIPPDDRRKIQAGDHLYLCSVPWEIVEAVRDEKLLHFNKDTFFHMKVGIIPSMNDRTKGWGLPMFMANFSQMVQLQILERFNEAMAMDYIVPCRMLTPTLSGQVGDPMRLHNSSTMLSALKSMIAEHRRDPTTWHIMPYPVQYTRIGGDAKQMVPVELIDRALDNLLTSMGIPQEFYRGTLNMGNGAPIGLRMFEKTWSHHTNNMNAWLKWFTNQVSKIMMWEDVNVTLVATSIQEDEMAKQVKLNLAASGVVSKYTALKSFGISPYEEIDRRLDEQRYEENKIREIQAESSNANMVSDAMAQATIPMNASQPNNGAPLQQPQGGGVPQGAPAGAPPISGAPPTIGGAPAIDDLMAQSQSMAQQIMTMDPATRRSQLTNLKSQNPTLHAQVKQMIKDMEQAAGQQGIQAARQGQA